MTHPRVSHCEIAQLAGRAVGPAVAPKRVRVLKGESPVKRSLLAFAFLVLAAVPSSAIERRTVLVVDEVIRMSGAGVSDEEIIAWLRKQKDPYELSGDDVIAMTDARVSRAVVKAVVDESAESLRADRDRDRRRTRTYVRPSTGWDPWYYGSAWYDPFWYGPRLSLGVTFGPRYGYYRGPYHREPFRYRRHR